MAPLKMDMNMSEDIKRMDSVWSRILIRGLIILVIGLTSWVVYMALKYDTLYNRLTIQDKECAERWIRIVNEANRKTEIAKALADSIHDQDQLQMRQLMRERIEAISQQSKQIDKELGK